MKVTLIDCTGFSAEDPADYAASILIFTKQTRLQMQPGLLAEIKAWPMQVKLDELEYMANTIPSSWEFVDYTFLIEGVTRAFTHQLVRTRNASYAQQTMRVLDVKGWDYYTGPSLEKSWIAKSIYQNGMLEIAERYNNMIREGAEIEDARGILPTNILTNIVMKANFRTYVELLRKRASPRTQGEYRDVAAAMRKEMIKIHPWADYFLNRTFDKAASELDIEIAALDISKEQKTKMIKLVDQMRAQS